MTEPRHISSPGPGPGGGVCFFINNNRCTDVETVSQSCSLVLEHLTIKCRSFYLPSEFTCVLLTDVYTPPEVPAAPALDELNAAVCESRLQTTWPSGVDLMDWASFPEAAGETSHCWSSAWNFAAAIFNHVLSSVFLPYRIHFYTFYWLSVFYEKPGVFYLSQLRYILNKQYN